MEVPERVAGATARHVSLAHLSFSAAIPLYPEAKHMDVVGHETPMRAELVRRGSVVSRQRQETASKMLRFSPVTFGVLVIDHRWPFQTSAKLRMRLAVFS